MEAAAAVAAPTEPILEEFMPLKNSTPAEDEKPTTITSDKANWMTSVQLWSQAGDVSKQQSESTDDHSKLQDRNNNNNNNNKDNNLETCSQRINNNGAFVPFNKDRSSGPAAKMELLEKGEKKNCSDNNSSIDGGVVVMAAEQRSENGAAEVGSGPTTTQTHRKARRCWSPDLHRRFVNALQMLGGSQGISNKSWFILNF